MKKVFKTIALCLTLPFALSFVACGHTHTYSEDWSTNATHHWHKATCDHTDETSSYGEHVYDNESDTICNTCSYERETATYNIWDGTAADVPAEETGVITISTAEELAGLAASVNEGTNYAGKTIKLACDINLKNIEWTPIGFGGGADIYGNVDSNSAVFKGVFDGQNHTISNLKITTFVGGAANEDASTGIGLFGSVLGATIKNIKIDTAEVSGNHFVAAAVGSSRGTTLENIEVKNANVSCVYLDEDESGDKAGVVVGYIGNLLTEDSSVSNCTVANSTVNAARDAGQVIGCLSIDVIYGTPQTISTQANNTANEVVVTDNNQTQNTSNNDNIKNEIVGRVNDSR